MGLLAGAAVTLVDDGEDGVGRGDVEPGLVGEVLVSEGEPSPEVAEGGGDAVSATHDAFRLGQCGGRVRRPPHGHHQAEAQGQRHEEDDERGVVGAVTVEHPPDEERREDAAER